MITCRNCYRDFPDRKTTGECPECGGELMLLHDQNNGRRTSSNKRKKLHPRQHRGSEQAESNSKQKGFKEVHKKLLKGLRNRAVEAEEYRRAAALHNRLAAL